MSSDTDPETTAPRSHTLTALHRLRRVTGWSPDRAWEARLGKDPLLPQDTRAGSVVWSKWQSGDRRPQVRQAVGFAGAVCRWWHHIAIEWNAYDTKMLASDLAVDVLSAAFADKWDDPDGQWPVTEIFRTIESSDLGTVWEQEGMAELRGPLLDCVVGALVGRYRFVRLGDFLYGPAVATSPLVDQVHHAENTILGLDDQQRDALMAFLASLHNDS